MKDAHDIDSLDRPVVGVWNGLVEHHKRRFDQHARTGPDLWPAPAKTRLFDQQLRFPFEAIEKPLGRLRLF